MFNKKQVEMHAYGFKVDDNQYYILGESTTKERTNIHQGASEMKKNNKIIAKRYSGPDGYTVPFGTIFDDDYQVVSSPEVTQSFAESAIASPQYFELIDATFVHIYRLGERVMIGTRNSWDITNSYDLYGELTYGKAFYSCLDRLGLSIDDISNGSYAFSHPLLHLTAKTYRLYSFTNTLIGNVSLSFDPLLTPDDGDFSSENYIIYDSDNSCYREVVSNKMEKLRRILYLNRRRFRGVDRDLKCDEIGMINCMLNYQCNATNEIKKYVSQHKLLNSIAHSCLSFVVGITRNLRQINPNDKTFYSVEIPEGIRDKKYSIIPLYFTFWREVLSNAYWHFHDRDSCRVQSFKVHY